MLSAAGASLAVRRVAAQTGARQATPTVYFADGYHGGAKGHMPAGAWRDILNTLRDIPQWKLCFDIEAPTWDVVLRDDPEAYRELKNYWSSSRLIRGSRW